MTARDSSGDLRNSLTEVARPAQRSVRSRRAKAAAAAAVVTAMPLLIAIPVVHILVRVILLPSESRLEVSPWAVAAFSFLVPIGYLGLEFVRAFNHGPSERSALTAIDDELRLHDRLSAAHEFLGHSNPSAFMQAAIEDARGHIEAARRAEFEARPAPIPWRSSQCLWLMAALGLIGLGELIDAPPVGIGAADAGRAEVASAAAPASDTTDRDQPSRPRNPVTATDRKVAPEAVSKPRKDAPSDDSDLQRRPSKGTVGRGKSASARSVGGRSAGEGAASAQAQPTKGGVKKKTKKTPVAAKKPTDRKKRKTDTPPDQKESVASAGRGKGKGASRSPTASDWSSKDQIVTEDDEEFDENEDVDDEEDESDARGGLQPNLRQRKPPVNRDLNIGFGSSKPPPFANGRGGPGLPKKQRGVAQLVLGVPYPDHITGQPNPGMTKVTQERIEPQSSPSPNITAESRRPRLAQMGRLFRSILEPWMQDLVRDFFDSRRQENNEE